jgi:feruloyl esterase
MERKINRHWKFRPGRRNSLQRFKYLPETGVCRRLHRHRAPGENHRWQWFIQGPNVWEDFVYRSRHLTTLVAKSIIQAYYRNAPEHSYFLGCSGGGKQALMEAQRYLSDFDGIIAGAPTIPTTYVFPGIVWRYYLINRGLQYAIPQEKLETIHQAALDACDANDGLVDGVIGDPLRCSFDPSTLLCKDINTQECLTPGEVDSLQKIYAGQYDPDTGAQFSPGLEPGGELFWGSKGFLAGELSGPPLDYFRYLLFADIPGWRWETFDFTNSQDFNTLTESDILYGSTFNATYPDLSAFREQGGKLIIYQGWPDEVSPPRNSTHYYDDGIVHGRGNQYARLFTALHGSRHDPLCARHRRPESKCILSLGNHPTMGRKQPRPGRNDKQRSE